MFGTSSSQASFLSHLLIIYFKFPLTYFACITLCNTYTHTYAQYFCGGRRDANKNETWGLCRRPPADWGTPWEWWSAGSLSLPCCWTRRSGLAAPPPLYPALPLLFLLLSCTGVYQQYTHPGCWASLAVITKSMNTPPHYLTVRASESKQNEYPVAASLFLNASIM